MEAGVRQLKQKQKHKKDKCAGKSPCIFFVNAETLTIVQDVYYNERYV